MESDKKQTQLTAKQQNDTNKILDKTAKLFDEYQKGVLKAVVTQEPTSQQKETSKPRPPGP